MKQQIVIEESRHCPECNSNQLEQDRQHGELVCQHCGLVIDEDLIDYSPEWRAFDSEQYNQRARTGSPMNEMIFDKGLSTTIGWQNKDHYGNSIPHRNRAQMYRIRKWHRRTKVRRGVEQNIREALHHIIRFSSTMSLPRTVRESAAVIYRKAAYNNLVRGRSIEGVAAAAVYAGCRQCNLPRSLDEISDASGISKKEIGRNYRYIARQLSLKLLPTKPQDFLNRFSNKLSLANKTTQKARDLIDRILEDNIISGCSPSSIAAAAIYVASLLCDDRKTQREVAETAGVTEVTIRNRYKELCDKLNIHVAI